MSTSEQVSRAKQLDRISFWFLVLLALLMPLILWGASHIKIGSASAHAWLPEGRVERARYEWFIDHFGSDQYLIASWENLTLSDPRLSALAQSIQDLDSRTEPLVESLQTSEEIFNGLVSPPLSLPPLAARARLEGSIIGKDGTAAIFIRFNPLGIASQKDSIELVRAAADRVEGLGQSNHRNLQQEHVQGHRVAVLVHKPAASYGAMH